MPLTGMQRRRKRLEEINLTPIVDGLSQRRAHIRTEIAGALQIRDPFERRLRVETLKRQFQSTESAWQEGAARLAAVRRELRDG